MPRELECLNLPPFRRTQALASSTFRLPPLDGSLTIPELYDWHYKHSPHHPLFMYSDDDGVVATIDWAQATKAMHRAGRRVAAVAQQAIDAKRPIFAILSGNGESVLALDVRSALISRKSLETRLHTTRSLQVSAGPASLPSRSLLEIPLAQSPTS